MPSLKFLPCWSFALFIAGIASPTRAADTYDLTPAPLGQATHRVSVELELAGELLANDWTAASKAEDDATTAQRLPLSVEAKLSYDERLLEQGRTARWYETAEANIKSGAGIRAPRLPHDRRLVLAQRGESGRVVLKPANGTLTRTELDLIDIIGDAQALDQLLPGKAVAEGEDWAIPDQAMATLLGLDSVAVCEVKGVLDSGNQRYVRFQIAGAVHGVVDSATTEFDVRAIGLFSRQQRRVTQLNLAMTEKRTIGPATPGLEGTAKAKIKRAPVATPGQLAAEKLKSLGKLKAASRLMLDAQRQGFRLEHSRDWFLAGETNESVTLRRVDASGLTAQTTLKRMSPKAEGRLTTPEQFEREIRYSLGEAFGNLVSSEQWTTPTGCRVMSLVVEGEAQGVPLEWRYYLAMPAAEVTDINLRHQVAMTTTIEKSLLKRVGKADRALVDGLQITKPVKATPGIAKAKATPKKQGVRTAKRRRSSTRTGGPILRR